MVEPNFDGSSVAGPHIGSSNSDSLSTLLGAETELSALVAKDAEILAVANDAVIVGATAGADAGNTMPVVIAVTDAAGAAVTAAVRLKCTMHDGTMIPSLAGAWTLAETGAGSEVSTTAQASLVIDTGATGGATVTVSDVATGTNETLYMVIEPLNAIGAKVLVELDFNT